MEEEQQEQKKISLPEAILMMEVVMLADGVEILVDLTGIGIIIGEVVNFATGVVIEGWLLLRGFRGARNLVSMGVGTILDGATTSFFPVKTITMAVTIWLVNHPKILEKAAIVGAVAGAAGAYKPSAAEMEKAEGMMTPEQKSMSATREKELTET